MNAILDHMLSKYTLNTINDKKNAIKEIMQEIVLCGLSRAEIFEKGVFIKFFKDRIDKESLRQALLNTCAKRNTENILTNPNEIIADIKNDRSYKPYGKTTQL